MELCADRLDVREQEVALQALTPAIVNLLLVVMVPLIKFLPQMLRWRGRSRIDRWYDELTLLERDVRLREGAPPIQRGLADLERIRIGVERATTPASFASEACTLREHIDLVGRAVKAKAAAAGSPLPFDSPP